MPQPGRRVYAYLRWNANGRTVERYVGEVVGEYRSELLRSGWRQAIENGLLPRSAEEARTANSWASTPAVRKVMQSKPGRDTKPERQLRSILHGMGLRYSIDKSPFPGVRTPADLVFPRAKVAVYVDGCLWHGCPDHYRPAQNHTEFWEAKLEENRLRDQNTNTMLAAHGWHTVRIWAHEDMTEVAGRIVDIVRGEALAGDR